MVTVLGALGKPASRLRPIGFEIVPAGVWIETLSPPPVCVSSIRIFRTTDKAMTTPIAATVNSPRDMEITLPVNAPAGPHQDVLVTNPNVAGPPSRQYLSGVLPGGDVISDPGAAPGSPAGRGRTIPLDMLSVVFGNPTNAGVI